ncbi:transposase [Pseudokineococcus sp. 1T1Z-3]|uniref:transposase n=1 Tax=Pseudokineococcus sp. 1T1Z-3 TaxID=3132745 RepID=UPI00309F71C2
MTLNQSALFELTEALKAADAGDMVRTVLAAMLQALIEAEATSVIGAARHERTPGRTPQRNGSRDKTLSTTAGDVTVKIPKTRTGSNFGSLLAPRRRIDVAPHAVVMEASPAGDGHTDLDQLLTAAKTAQFNPQSSTRTYTTQRGSVHRPDRSRAR